MQNCLHEYWHIVGCPNLFCKLTNKLKASMDSTTNLLHVQVARMLAFVLWDSIGKKFGRLPNFYIYSNIILDLLGLTNLGTKCEEVVCKCEQVRELRFETAISVCILHFATCIFQNLPVAKTYISNRIHKVDLQL